MKMKFEVTPLDIGISKLLFTLEQEFAAALAQEAGRSEFSYTFENKDQRLDLSTFSIVCRPYEQGGQWLLLFSCRDRAGQRELNRIAFKGGEQELLQYLRQYARKLFLAGKQLVIELQQERSDGLQ